jgi:hypothetical protein
MKTLRPAPAVFEVLCRDYLRLAPPLACKLWRCLCCDDSATATTVCFHATRLAHAQDRKDALAQFLMVSVPQTFFRLTAG